MLIKTLAAGCATIAVPAVQILAQTGDPSGFANSLAGAGALGVIVLILFGFLHRRMNQDIEERKNERLERQAEREERVKERAELTAEMRATNRSLNLLIRSQMVTISALKTLPLHLRGQADDIRTDVEREIGEK